MAWPALRGLAEQQDMHTAALPSLCDARGLSSVQKQQVARRMQWLPVDRLLLYLQLYRSLAGTMHAECVDSCSLRMR